MLYAGRLQWGRFQLGEGDELSVIAAAVLGGTSLFGGKGTVIGTIVVVPWMIGMINNGLILMGLEYSQQLIARGGDHHPRGCLVTAVVNDLPTCPRSPMLRVARVCRRRR